MTDLLGPQGLPVLCEFAARRPLCLFDFDGTLAPLVPDPAHALLPHPVQLRLQALQARAPVGIVTGRSLADLRARLEFSPDYLIGNHGLEGLPGDTGPQAAPVEACERWRAWLAPRLSAIDPGIWLEDKQLSVSIHYLRAHDPRVAEPRLRALFAELFPAPRVIPGKYLFNLLPAGCGNKGAAVLQLLRLTGAGGALYVGDDVTDEDVFGLRHPDILSVRVEPSASSAAPWYVADHAAMLPLLDRLIDCLPERPRASGHAGGTA
jgi:trehalose 6-phosphate phosphatase